MHSFRLFVPILFALSTAASCGGGGGGGGGTPTPDLSGTISVFSTNGPLSENESNDDLSRAQALGALAVGSGLTVAGSADSLSDPIDAYRIAAPERARFEVRVSLDRAGAADLDLLVYDTTSLQIVEAFPSVATNGASFHAKGSFLVVLFAHEGASGYELAIRAERPESSIVVDGPHTDSLGVHWLGELLVGETVLVRGSADATGDLPDRMLVTFPESLDLEADLAFAPGLEGELAVLDASAGLTHSFEVARWSASATSSLAGVSSMRALVFEVRASAGGGAWELALHAHEASGTASPTIATSRGLAPFEEETRWLRGRVLSHPIGTVEMDAVEGQAVVRAREGADLALALERRGAREVLRTPGGAMKVEIELPVALSSADELRFTLAWIESLAARDEVRYVEPNHVYRVFGEPNDVHYHLQWHYQLIQLPTAWDVSKGAASVIVAVIDTGKTAHPDLAARQLAGYDLISDPESAGDGDGTDADATDEGDGNGATPSSFHGTHVAGTIGAVTNNTQGVAGVTWMGKILHVRALGKEGGTIFDIANAVLYAAKLDNSSGALPAQPARVINMSVGGPGFSQTLLDALTDARAEGLVLFAAAGNENSNEPSYPAAYEGVISVSAVDYDGNKAPYSNFHPTVDIAAPGGDLSANLNGDAYPDGVLSTLYDDTTAEYVYAFYEGTSMACPHAAGVAALMIAAAPGIGPATIEGILESTAVDRGAAGKDSIYGHGLINAAAAVNEAAGGGSTTPILGLGSQEANFEIGTSEKEIAVFNVGGGMLEVEDPVVSTISGGAWLSAERIASASSSSDTDAIHIAVDRSGLAEGTYSGDVLVNSNGGSLNIDVTLEVGPEAVADDVDIFVLVLNAETLETVGETVVNPITTLVYSFADLPAGDYQIFAGSDDDNDGFICGDGDTFCGAWPTMSEPGILTIADGAPLENVDFVVTSGTGTAGNDERRGIARLD